MDASAFEAQLAADGYTEIEVKEYSHRPANDEHGHHFAIRGLVLEGSFIVTQDGQAVAYGPGDIFSVPEGHPHHEEIGPQGARIIVGRKELT